METREYVVREYDRYTDMREAYRQAFVYDRWRQTVGARILRLRVEIMYAAWLSGEIE